jgi:hypothetical protein
MAEKVQPATTVSTAPGSNGHNGTSTPVPKIQKAKTDDTDLDDYFVCSIPIRNLTCNSMLIRTSGRTPRSGPPLKMACIPPTTRQYYPRDGPAPSLCRRLVHPHHLHLQVCA